jgi:hypothetical protein
LYTIFSQFLSFSFIQTFNVNKRRKASCIKLLANVSEGYGVVEFCAGYHVIFPSNSIYEMLENAMTDLIIMELVFTQYLHTQRVTKFLGQLTSIHLIHTAA